MQNIPENWENNAEQRTDVLFLWEKFRHPSTLEKIKIHPEVDILIYSHAAIIWHMERKDHAKSKMRDFI